MLTALTGCAVGTDFKRPEAPKSDRYADTAAPEKTITTSGHLGESQHFNTAIDIPHDWWTLFRSPQLNSLIQRALKNNPSIESAQAALNQAQEYANAQQGFFYPTVGVSYTPSRNKLAGNMGGNSPGVQANGQNIQVYNNPNGPVFNAPAYYSFHVAQLTVGYVPDVFGLNRRMMESAEAQIEVQKLQLEAAYLSLSNNVVAAALQEASLRAQIAAAEKVVQVNQEYLSIQNTQLKLGYTSGMEVAAQESALAIAEQSLIPLKRQLELTRNLLRTLAGEAPNAELTEKFELADLQLPQELPLTLPSKLVKQRPDVRAAEAQLHVASAQAGVAEANRFPQFALVAGIGGMATSPDWMFKHGGGFFNIAGNVAATIFDGGTLKAKSRAAQQAVILADAQYRSTVMVALQDVANALYTIQSDADALHAASKSTQAAQHALELTRQQYQLGQVNYQTQLAAEQAYQLSEINLIQAKTNRLGDTAALYQALGGGWWNRTDGDGVSVSALSPVVSNVVPVPVSGESIQ
ncbi:MAG: efflux transporter outer membrane subunit [Gallionella sp.]|nr:efflux transporter outer membrane subunit [Gallionella sp.]MDD4957884.1 efflux transporter outer membrane subunit [Gallionella sp.]